MTILTSPILETRLNRQPLVITVIDDDDDATVSTSCYHDEGEVLKSNHYRDEDEALKSRLPYWDSVLDEWQQGVLDQQHHQQVTGQRMQQREKVLTKHLEKWETQLDHVQSQQELDANSMALKVVQQQFQRFQEAQHERQRESEMSDLRLEMSRSSRYHRVLRQKVVTMEVLAQDASFLIDRLAKDQDQQHAQQDDASVATTDSKLRKELRRIQSSVTRELDELQDMERTILASSSYSPESLQRQRQDLQNQRDLFLDQLEDKRRNCLKRFALTKEIQSLRQKNEALRNSKKGDVVQGAGGAEDGVASSTTNGTTSAHASSAPATDPFVPALHLELKRTLQELADSFKSSPDKAGKILEAAHWALASKMYSDNRAVGCTEEEIAKKREEAISYMRLEIKQLRKDFELSTDMTMTAEGSGNSPGRKPKQPIKWERAKGGHPDGTSSTTDTSPLSVGTTAAGATQSSLLGGGNKSSIQFLLPSAQPRPRITKTDVAMACRRRYERLNARRRNSLAELLAAIPDSITEETASDLITKSSSSRNTVSDSISGSRSSRWSNDSPPEGATLSSGEYSSSTTSLSDGPPWYSPTYKESPQSVTQFVQPKQLQKK
jgi:hypothetical protein